MQTIYILDYNADNAFALCEWLRSHGVKAKRFSTLEQLLNSLKINQPDCIILDCLFDRISLTSNICHTIRNIFHFTGTIWLSSPFTISANDLKACNASGFIAKPFESEIVLDLVNELSGNAITMSIA